MIPQVQAIFYTRTGVCTVTPTLAGVGTALTVTGIVNIVPPGGNSWTNLYFEVMSPTQSPYQTTLSGQPSSRIVYFLYAPDEIGTWQFRFGGEEQTIGNDTYSSFLSEWVDVSVVIDATPPTNCSVLINSGAASTDSVDVNLTLSASDLESGVSWMRFRHTSQENFTSWESYSASKSWTLGPIGPGYTYGSKGVTVEFMNGEELTTIASDYIDLDDPTPPTAGIIITTDPNGWSVPHTTDVNVYLRIFALDNESYIDSIRIRNSGEDWSPLMMYRDKIPWELPAGLGNKTVELWVRNGDDDISTAQGSIELIPSEWGLTIQVEGAGSTNPSVGTSGYADGTQFDVRAEPSSGWSFDHWILDGEIMGPTNPFRITMNADHVLTAVFTDATPPTGFIMINNGAATTNSRDVTLTFSASDPQSEVTQMRFRNSGGSWSNWQTYSTERSWTLSSGEGTKTVESQFMNEAELISITYSDTITLETHLQYGLTVSAEGSGSTTPIIGTHSYADGVKVSVSASPDGDWIFDHWELDGVNVGSVNPYTLTMSSNCILIAVFHPPTGNIFALAIQVVGSGTTDPKPGDYETDEGELVDVGASPDIGWKFDHWELDGINVGNDSSYTLTMNNNYVLSAVFVEANVSDSDPPIIQDHTVNPEEPTEDKDVTIEFTVMDEDSGVKSVELLYSVSGSDWKALFMRFNGETWSCTIPKQSVGSMVEFHAICYDNLGNSVESETYYYEIAKDDAIELGIVAGVAIGVAGSTGGILLVLKATGKSVLSLGKKTSTLRLDKKEPRTKSKNQKKDDKKKKKKKTPKKALLKLMIIDSPKIIAGGMTYKVKLRVKNFGPYTAEGVLLSVCSTPGLNWQNKTEKISSLKLGKESTVDFTFTASQELNRGQYRLRFTAKGKNTFRRVKTKRVRAVKIGLLADHGKENQLTQYKKWLKTKSIPWDELHNADDVLKLLSYDLIVAAPDFDKHPKRARVLSSFVENSRTLIKMTNKDLIETKILEKTVGY